jgi:outer membrane protein OmpA-like peptidoglycan-associated protein
MKHPRNEENRMKRPTPFRPARRLGTVLCLPILALAVAGCGSMSERERGTAQGAGIGAVAGAVIGSATGGNAGRSAAIGGVVGAVAGNLWSKRMEDKREALARASQGTGVEVARTADNRLKLNVPSDVSFDTGRADIKPQMRPVLDEIGRNLDPNVHVTIVGHTDSTGSDAINDPLSRDRAMAVRDYLSARGLAPSRVSVSGRGSREPVASNDTEAGRAANRRVEIFLSEQNA